MRLAAAVLIAGLLLVPSVGVAQETVPAAVEAPRPLAGQAEALRCKGADAKICVAAISGAAVVAVIAANAASGGALTPVLMAGNGGLSTAVVALIVAHLGIDIVLITGGPVAAVVTGVADPVVTAGSEAYAAAKSYVATAADSVSTAAGDAGTAVGNWLTGR